MAVFAVLLFALAGLISGFAVGGFVRPKIGGTANNQNGNSINPIVQQTKTATPVATVHPVKLGFPVITAIKYHEKADGTTTYTFTTYAVDQSIDKEHGKRVNVAGITGKLWLQHVPQNDFVNLPGDRLRHLDIQGPLTDDEIAGALNFVSGSSQIEQTNANGQITWNYTLSASVPPGSYYLTVLLDWSGQSYNWSWRQITVTD
jgi:hypothetical protein